jgi:ketosteroid isomerase-like protein
MNKQLIYDFAKAINEHDVQKICSLMSVDHRFVDPYGNEAVGIDMMKSGWKGYFEWFPDYEIEITELISYGDTFAAFGFAGGTFEGKKSVSSQNTWRLPAAWKVVVKDDRICLWQVYADTKIPFTIIENNKER